MPSRCCHGCKAPPSQVAFGQNQLRKLSRGQHALCQSCSTAQRKPSQTAPRTQPSVQEWRSKVSGGFDDGQSRSYGGKARKAAKPPKDLKATATAMIADMRALYDVKSFNYFEAFDRLTSPHVARMAQAEFLSATYCRAQAQLAYFTEADKLLRGFAWLQPQRGGG